MQEGLEQKTRCEIGVWSWSYSHPTFLWSIDHKTKEATNVLKTESTFSTKTLWTVWQRELRMEPAPRTDQWLADATPLWFMWTPSVGDASWSDVIKWRGASPRRPPHPSPPVNRRAMCSSRDQNFLSLFARDGRIFRFWKLLWTKVDFVGIQSRNFIPRFSIQTILQNRLRNPRRTVQLEFCWFGHFIVGKTSRVCKIKILRFRLYCVLARHVRFSKLTFLLLSVAWTKTSKTDEVSRREKVTLSCRFLALVVFGRYTSKLHFHRVLWLRFFAQHRGV